MDAFYNRIIFVSAMALTLGLLGCDRTGDYDTSSSKQSSAATDRSASSASDKSTSGDSAAPSDKMASNESSASSKSSVVEDSVITGKVKAALLTDPDIKSTEITVDTKQGVVHLGGVAKNQDQASKAASVARSIDGVSAVENNISVKG